MFDRLGHLTYSRRYWVLVLAGLFLVIGGVWGTGVFAAMVSSGFEDPGSESAAALERVQDSVGRDEADVVVLYRDRFGATVERPAFRADVESSLAGLPASLVTGVTTAWSAGPGGAALVSEDGRSTYAVVHVVGNDEDARMDAYEALEPRLRDAPDGLVVRLGGGEAIASDITTQVGEDIARAE
ncbi:MAG: MMPL family transporter, partial [Spirochaetaceae bacterium]|nr:MMPL family transporter [Spirochaetaceae bacterium]